MSMYDCRHENPAAKKMMDCEECGYGIFIGDAYYEINDLVVCEDCIIQFKKECEEE